MIATIERARSWYPNRLLFAAVVPVLAVWAVVVVTMPMQVPVALAGLTIVVVPVALVALGSSVDGAARWSRERGAVFSPGWTAVLRRHLVRTRVARTLGVTLGLAAPVLAMARYNADTTSFSWFPDLQNHVNTIVLAGVGYAVGSVWAEVTKPRRGGAPGAAMLAPRRVGDYLDPNVSWALFCFAVLAGVAVGVGAVVATGEPGTAAVDWIAPGSAAVVAAGAMFAVWWCCRRRERAADDAALAYEELTRTATVNALAGTAVAMLGLVAATVPAPAGGPTWLWWLRLPLGLASFAGVSIWIGSGTKLVFRSRRIDALRAAA